MYYMQHGGLASLIGKAKIIPHPRKPETLEYTDTKLGRADYDGEDTHHAKIGSNHLIGVAWRVGEKRPIFF